MTLRRWFKLALFAATALTSAPLAMADDLSVLDNHGTLPLPTGQYITPQASPSATLYVSNGKSDPGPDPSHLTSSTASLAQTTYPGGNAAATAAFSASNQYVYQLEHAGLLSVPVPSRSTLSALTIQVTQNNGYASPVSDQDAAVMAGKPYPAIRGEVARRQSAELIPTAAPTR